MPGGCDCIGLIIGIAKELKLKSKIGGIIADFDEQDYPEIYDLSYIKGKLDNHLQAINITNIQKADILLMNFDSITNHIAIVSSISSEMAGDITKIRNSAYFYIQNYHKNLNIIHAYKPASKVIEQQFDIRWYKYLVAAYRFSDIKSCDDYN